ncbi:unnamed protein product [Durusdinium trenchii]|uniref:Uncharacterized protein n=1 Tax=Durusdinium trenchii TaxID=1381693 RepID=A0ABP0IAG1_9DINO
MSLEVRDAPFVLGRQQDAAKLQFHLSTCSQGYKACLHCRFAAGYLGRLAKKASGLKPPNRERSWKHKCTFELGGDQVTWLVCLDEPLQVGCYVCHRAGVKSAFGNLKVSITEEALQIANFQNHAKYKGHVRALQKLAAVEPCGSLPPVAEQVDGHVSGLPLNVPRIDRWVSAVDLLVARAGYRQGTGRVEGGSVGSALMAGGDGSSKVMKQMLECLRSGLDLVDLQRMKKAVSASIAIDKGHGHLVVYGRILGPDGLHDFFLGLGADAVPDSNEPDPSRAVLRSLEQVVKRACMVRVAARRTNSLYESPEDYFDDSTYQHFRKCVVSMVADGAYTEQRALYEASPLAGELGGSAQDCLFPCCKLITRDRAHRWRSVDRGFRGSLPSTFQDFLSKLVTGERSLARMLETSEKFARAFQAKQAESDAPGFARVLRSFGYREQRFDSRKRPLFRLFKMLMICIELLEDVATAGGPFDESDQAWATKLLEDFGGDAGFCRVVGAAVAADALVIAWPLAQVNDEARSDYSLEGPAAAKVLLELKLLLADGGLFLPEASATLTHSVLSAVKERMVWCGKGTATCKMIPIRWPRLDTPARCEPLRIAREFYKIFEAFKLPQEANAFAAFNLSEEISMANREKWIKVLAERFNLDGAQAWRSFFGNGESTGLLLRAKWHFLHGGQDAASKPASCHVPESAHQAECEDIFESSFVCHMNSVQNPKRFVEDVSLKEQPTWEATCAHIVARRPRFGLLENVMGLMQLGDGYILYASGGGNSDKLLNSLLERLRGIEGYTVAASLATAFPLPADRNRCLIFISRDECHPAERNTCLEDCPQGELLKAGAGQTALDDAQDTADYFGYFSIALEKAISNHRLPADAKVCPREQRPSSTHASLEQDTLGPCTS